MHRGWRIALIGALVGTACTSTLSLSDGTRSGDETGDRENDASSDATTDVDASDAGAPSKDGDVDGNGALEGGTDPTADLPVLHLPAAGANPAILEFKLAIGTPTQALLGPASGSTGDTWPCDHSVSSNPSVSVPTYDFVIVNDDDRPASVAILLVGPAYAANTLQRRDVGMAIYFRDQFPSDRRDCSGVMAVDCSNCGDTSEPPVGLGALQAITLPAKGRLLASAFALAPGKYGQLGVVAGGPP